MSSTDKYPLLQRIFDEQDGLFRFLESETPAPLKEMQLRIVGLLEETISRPAAEKEALMVATVIALAPPYLLDDTTRFSEEYSPEIASVINEMLRAQPQAPLPKDFAQVTAAMGTVMMQDIALGIKDGSMAASAEQIAQSFREAEADEPFVFQNLDAPQLKAAFDAAKAEVAAALAATAAPKAAPAAKKPRVFKP